MERAAVRNRRRLRRPECAIAIARQECSRECFQHHQIDFSITVEVSLDHVSGAERHGVRDLRRKRTCARTQRYRPELLPWSAFLGWNVAEIPCVPTAKLILIDAVPAAVSGAAAIRCGDAAVS